MNLAGINLNLLVALDALLAEVHVGRAARKIGLSQPAASHALRQLRELFGDPLLVRVGGRMELTPRGGALRESVAEALRRVDSLLLAAPFDPKTSSRQFRVMLHDHVAPLLVPELLERMHQQAPKARLEVLAWQNPAALGAERARSLDIFVSCSPREFSGFQRQVLFSDTEVTVCRKGHPAVAHLKRLAVFLAAQHVAVVGLGMAEDPVDEWLRQEGFSRQVALRVPSYIPALQVVSQTNLVAFVPRRLAEFFASTWSLEILPPPVDPGEYEEYLFCPVPRLQDPASLWLRQLIFETGPALGSQTLANQNKPLRR